MIQSFKLITAFLLIMALTACPSTDISQSKFVKQSEICQVYQLEAEEENNRLDALAYFRFGGSKGTTLILNDSTGSLIKMNDEVMALVQNSSGAYYSHSGLFIPGVKTFTFVDGDGKSYVNKINCNLFNVYNMPKDIDRNKILELNYEGSEPEKSETFICEYQDTSMTFSSDYTITEIKGNKLFLPLNVFKNMQNGPVTLRFYRKNSLPTLLHGNIPGSLDYRYRGLEFKCNLTGKGNEFVKNER